MSKVNTLVVDAGPLIINGYSAFASLADEFLTTPSVYNEIRDERARQNLLLWGDRLVVRQPNAKYLQIVSDFARKTGDYAVLSSTDLQIIALTYELECEKNGGDWRLRSRPGQQATNGASTQSNSAEQQVEQTAQSLENLKVEDESNGAAAATDSETKEAEPVDDGWNTISRKTRNTKKKQHKNYLPQKEFAGASPFKAVPEPVVEEVRVPSAQSEAVEHTPDTDPADADADADIRPEDAVDADEHDSFSEDEDDDGEGWITPETLHHQQVLDGTVDAAAPGSTEPTVLKVGMASGDFAMQNVALQIGLNVINPQSGYQIKKIRSWMLRCHACFFLTPPPTGDKPRQFCPRCGGATLLRCTVTTSAETGKVQVHLKRNFQWSHRGNRYSIPTPQSKQNRRTGGEGAEEILLREDQKEYLKAVKNDAWQKRHNQKMLDEWIGGASDTLGSPFASGSYKRDNTTKSGVKVGKSRYVNERRRK
ncbi:Nin one binding Zn-ribbon like-domain-containing protein [Myxozyma melibiosi]|uniref:20S-pre-rRNA D-site endonuclease NOB1 n=1 Tax=Myxozyma melibiosi TaxID=54550 RepID=A0ABR1FDD1_9ASCO